MARAEAMCNDATGGTRWEAEQQSAALQWQSWPPAGDRSSPGATVTAGYRRCFDFDPSNAPGQDYSGFHVDCRRIVGVVADGVSQSFFGNLAAHEVGAALLDHLWERRDEPPAEGQLAEILDGLIAKVADLVRDQALSAPPDSILARALEKTRAKGSQTVFAAFVLDVPRRRGVLYQLGDIVSRVRIGQQWNEQPTNAKGRWSSVPGNHRELLCKQLEEVTGILLHSDGLRPAWREQFEQGTAGQESFAAEAGLAAAVDDVSFVSALVEERSAGAGGGSAAEHHDGRGARPSLSAADPLESDPAPERLQQRGRKGSEPRGRRRWWQRISSWPWRRFLAVSAAATLGCVLLARRRSGRKLPATGRRGLLGCWIMLPAVGGWR